MILYFLQIILFLLHLFIYLFCLYYFRQGYAIGCIEGRTAIEYFNPNTNGIYINIFTYFNSNYYCIDRNTSNFMFRCHR